MTNRPAILGLLATVTIAADGAAQAQATTLARLSHSAVIVHATVAAVTDPSPDLHRIVFRTREVLRGEPPETFALVEPSGRCCGRTLFGMLPGAEMLLFLERRSTGFHLAGGSRGAVAAAPAVLAHVRALQAAATEVQLARLLAAATLHGDPRVRTDACLHLPTLAALDLDGPGREALRLALAEAVRDRTAALPALVDATVRAGGDDVAATLLRPFLGGSRADVAALLREGLQRLADSNVIDALAGHWPADDAARTRAADLLCGREPALARPVALRLLREAESPRAALAACEALLGLGLGPEDLRTLAAGPVIQLAVRRRAAPPHYRNVRREVLR